MDVSSCFAACPDGVFAIQSEMGLTGNDMRMGRRLSFAVVHVESDFEAEFVAGDTIRLETSVAAVGAKSMTFRHRLIRCEGDALAFETVFNCAMLSLDACQAAAIPDDARERATTWLET
ncbi:acyl-CoA thioesterase [Pikeienuella piscinae]|uniref:Acyl-CoA thioesterase n=1 Tax=Pikeienuella piscinae TaxID=2748098 RepID=A0A7L5BSE8_9RHOB|nr:acyl-CoA thioesterase [Pikeienuella piscinae]QIE54050.1 acyl-CoA thioesterase [Pikeienuella piscinae]